MVYGIFTHYQAIQATIRFSLILGRAPCIFRLSSKTDDLDK